MKNLILLFFLFALSNTAFSNKIDSLKTNKDVSSFIISLDSIFRQKDMPSPIIRSTDQILNDNGGGKLARKIGVKNWVKTDFNNDKLTDLLAILYWDNRYLTVIVIDKGGDQFQSIILNYSVFEKYEFSKTIHIKNSQLVLFYTNKSDVVSEDDYPGIRHASADTLIYKFDHFIELNRSRAPYKVDSVIFHSGPCYGTCPDFTIKLDDKGNATLVSEGMWEIKKGRFHSLIKDGEMQQIKNIISYIQIKKLHNHYAVPWTDDATATITVKFADGSTKNISDYGEVGTFGLRALYSIFFDMKAKQAWQ